MHINLESVEPHSIQAYSDNVIRVNSIDYQNSIIISSREIITDWAIDTILHLTEEALEPLLRYNPNIIIIGHKQQGTLLPVTTLASLSKKRIGLESMSIGAACRTFNVLLSELREVVIGIIL